MSSLRSIEIDFDVHRTIEMNRTGFEETPNAVLRRLLGLDAVIPPKNEAETSGRAWRRMGVELPHGAKLRMSYNGATSDGVVDDGSLLVGGVRHTTPSSAATAVAKTRSGRQTNLNGWNYWETMLPGANAWVPLNQLWREAEARKRA